MGGYQSGWFRVHVQGMHRGGGSGERSGMSAADGAGLRYEDKGEETGSSVTTTGVNQVGEAQAREEAAGNFRTEEMITGDEGEIRTEERKEICSGATLMATHAYTRNPESPIGKEIDLQQWETLVFKGLHTENEHWRLVEDRHGEVGYAPAAFLVVILDTTAGEEENDTTKKGQVNSSVLPRPFSEGGMPCPFLVTPCPFQKAEMTPCHFFVTPNDALLHFT